MGLGEKRRQWKNYLPPVINTDPRGFHVRIRQFFEWMHTKGYSKYTLYNRQAYFRDFVAWCELRGITRPAEVTRPILERYQHHIATRISDRTGRTVGYVMQRNVMNAIIGLFRWLTRNNHILYNPAADIEMPRRPKRLPPPGFSVEDIESALSFPNVTTPLGLRDRAMMELIYSTGIRRGEVPGLRLQDLNLTDRTLYIREGKGNRDRYVPIGKRACLWTNRYLEFSRPQLVVGHDDRWLILTCKGEFMTPDMVSFTVKKYILQAEIQKRGSAHMLRHAAATHMLENGANIRFIQAFLGHERLETTAIYTRVVINALRKIHTLTHPAGQVEDGPMQSPSMESIEEKQLLVPRADANVVADESSDRQHLSGPNGAKDSTPHPANVADGGNGARPPLEANP